MDLTNDVYRFLKALWPDPELPGWLLLWGIPSKRSEWIKVITETVVTQTILPWAEQEDVYVGCGLRRENLGRTERGSLRDVAAIPGIWLDIDYGTEHKKKNLPQTEEDARTLLDAMGLPPSMIVHSGRGLQAWWIFREPWILDTDEERAKAERLTKAWNNTLRLKAKQVHCDADSVWDLPRVMRIPGTWNRKRIPIKTRLLSLTDLRCDAGDFDTYLAVEAERKEENPQRSWHYDLHPQAEPPAKKLSLLLRINPRFEGSWFNKRPDLQNDDDESAIDLSLMSHAYVAGWSAQEMVNLCIAHRRENGKDFKLRKDYYDLTLNKAAGRKATEEREALLRDLEAGSTIPEELKSDPATILETISDQLKVSITKFLRYKADNNTYELDVKGEKITIEAIEQIESQTQFRRLILDRVDHLIPTFKPAMWGSIIQRLFLCVENVDVGRQATVIGSYTQWIDAYLGHQGIVNSDGWQMAAAKGHPYKVDDEVWISREDFFHYVVNNFKEKIGLRELAGVLRRMGFENRARTFRDKKGRVINRAFWRVPWSV